MPNKLNIPGVSTVTDTLEIEKSQTENQNTEEGLSLEEFLNFYSHPSNRNPSEWRIEANGDEISATNNTSRNTFEGTIEDFNRILRG